MNILGIILVFFSFCIQFFLPFNIDLISTFFIIFYLISILFLCLLIYKINISKKINYDILFLILTLWISNIMGVIYLNIFNNYIISFSCYLVSFIDVLNGPSDGFALP